MKRESGISLIEVLVAVLVLSIGLLGIAGLQTAALTTNSISYQYSQAALMAESMAERMRANPQAFVLNSTPGYSMTAGTAPGASSANCISQSCSNPSDQALWDEAIFYSQVTGAANNSGAPVLTVQTGGSAVAGLPSGATSISCTNPFPNNGTCLITVYWDPGRTATSTNYTCNSTDPTALRCFTLVFAP
ncbi:MAG: type IV pilus modification protein PilV [Nevskia sp.]|nr:type IV pilus modification protein PilV [Nevskia sp.]